MAVVQSEGLQENLANCAGRGELSVVRPARSVVLSPGNPIAHDQALLPGLGRTAICYHAHCGSAECRGALRVRCARNPQGGCAVKSGNGKCADAFLLGGLVAEARGGKCAPGIGTAWGRVAIAVVRACVADAIRRDALTIFTDLPTRARAITRRAALGALSPAQPLTAGTAAHATRADLAATTRGATRLRFAFPLLTDLTDAARRLALFLLLLPGPAVLHANPGTGPKRAQETQTSSSGEPVTQVGDEAIEQLSIHSGALLSVAYTRSPS